ncbi:MAG: TRAP transporter small permease subunit [Alphaproteobacteria bacterium]|nr:TRAP transporter small permease subunit [Alphaproteobacteria bacterium]
MTTVASRPLAASAAAADSRRSWAARLDTGIGAVIEVVSAALVVVEIVVLFCGILARYVFHRPLVWSDELASLLFLWLAMLGSVLAFRASEHMRMTALVSKASGSLRRFLELIALFATVAFLVFILHPALAGGVLLQARALDAEQPSLQLAHGGSRRQHRA